jgi:PAS domain-containing protein
MSAVVGAAAATTCVVVIDAETYQILDCNPAAVKIYGYTSKEQILAKIPSDLSAPLQYDDTPSDKKADIFIKRAKIEGIDI